ncbi:MAG: 1-acyl-sn-glycerol-3-phosphate acyltransferase [Deltaproteobacteria bacterium]|nr:1-acyl-sn-glycerol-3-phosphate acyltransferase [Deltaproteobacteria bacterium]
MATLVVVFFPFSSRIGYGLHRLWGIGLCKLTGIGVRVEGLENLPRHQGVILAPNHSSMFDMFILTRLPVNYRWISKEQIGKIPFIGWAMKAMGCYFVRRDHSDHDLKVVKQVEADLAKGASICIFPEGTRTRTGELLPFKKGSFRIAQNAGVPMIPVALAGTYSIAPPGKLPRRYGHDVTIRIGKPFFISPSQPLDQAVAQFRQQLIRLLG